MDNTTEFAKKNVSAKFRNDVGSLKTEDDVINMLKPKNCYILKMTNPSKLSGHSTDGLVRNK